jgi:Ser/Thr protein kinase RdoA (MazF antagonist)
MPGIAPGLRKVHMERVFSNEEQDVALAYRIAVACYGQDARLEPLTRLNNAVFRVHCGDGTRIVKLALTPDAGALRKERMLLDLLRRHGIPVPVLEHADLDARLVGRPFLAMLDAGGANLAQALQSGSADVPALMNEMGAVLARVHGLSFEQGGEIRAEGIVPRDTAAYLRRILARGDWAARQGLIDASEASLFRSLPMPSMDGTSLCHGDFHAVQCVVRDGRITAVVDWEKAWSGNAEIDLAVTHAYLESYCPAEPLSQFFTGYLAHRALPPGYARDSLPARMAHALGLMQVWHAQGRAQFVARGIELFRAYARAWMAT